MSYSSNDAGIEQHVEALAGGELALAVLGVDALLAAAETRFGAPGFERLDDLLHAPPGISCALSATEPRSRPTAQAFYRMVK